MILDQRRDPFEIPMSHVASDVRRTLQTLLSSPGFSLVAVLSLALGIGLATGTFAVANGVMLRSLPVPRPSELRQITWTGAKKNFEAFSGSMETRGNTSRGNAFSWELCQGLIRSTADTGQVLAFAPYSGVTVQTGREIFVAGGMMVSGGFFDALELRARLGRTFGGNPSASEPAALVVSDAFWRRHLGQDPAAVGRVLSLNGSPFTVIGVLPPDFRGVDPGDPPAFYVPISVSRLFGHGFPIDPAEAWWLQVMARVRPDREAAFREAANVAFVTRLKDRSEGPALAFQDARLGPNSRARDHRETLLLLLGGTGILLLAACANLSGLTLTRGASRRHEISVRAALGASRNQMMGPVLLESALLSLAGAGLGFILAIAVRNGLSRLLVGSPDGLAFDLSISPRVLAFTTGMTLMAILLSGLPTALRAAGTPPLDGLKDHAVRTTRRPALGRILIVVQIALSLTLLSGAGLMLRSMAGLLRVDPGFDTRNLLVASADPGNNLLDGQGAAFHGAVLERLATLPGVESASLVMVPLLSKNSWLQSFEFPGQALANPDVQSAQILEVDEGFFPALGIRILQGRGLSRSDDLGAPRVVVVNATFRKRFLSDREPLDQELKLGQDTWRIVGVCGDIRSLSLRDPAKPTIFFPFRQRKMGEASYLIRTSSPAATVIPLVRSAVSSVDAGVPLSMVSTQRELIDRQIRQERLLTILATAMAAFSLLLSCIGLYGLMAFEAQRRLGEFGIRMALGAPPRNIRWQVLREALALVAVGAALGLGASLALTRILKAFLFGVTPADPATFGWVLGLMAAVALAASLIPAWRASRADPAETLRAR
jgi:predicted permease